MAQYGIQRMLMAQTNPCNSLGEVHDTVQNAITGLGGSGWVYVPPGTWNEALTISDDYVMLFGAGWSSIIDGGTTGHAIDITGDYCIVKDLQVKTDVGGGNAYDAIDAANSDYGIIENVFVNGADQYGIYCPAASVVANCYVYDADADDIIANASPVTGIRIIGNYIEKGGYGIVMWSSGDDSVCVGNVINNTGSDGIYIHTDAENCVVDGNRITSWVGEAVDDDSGTSTVGDNDDT